MRSEFQLKEDICEVGRRIYQNGYVAANDGNITVRIGENEVLTTPTGVSKGFMNPQMIIKVNMDGEVLSGDLKPSSELKMHLRVYKERPDVRSVIHAIRRQQLVLLAGIPLVRCILPEVIISLALFPSQSTAHLLQKRFRCHYEIPYRLRCSATGKPWGFDCRHGSLQRLFQNGNPGALCQISLVARSWEGNKSFPKNR